MKIVDIQYLYLVLWFVLAFSCSSDRKSSDETSSVSYYSMEDYEQVSKIDAHVHIRTTGTAFMERARMDNFRLLTMMVDEVIGIALHEEHTIIAVITFH